MFIARAAVAAAAIAAPLAFAAPAMAQPMDFSCAPCVADVNGDNVVEPIWNELTSFGPWETVFDPAGNGRGPWEQVFDSTDGVPNDGQGAWEKVFPPAE
jgi:ABC-type transport system substrate-binding protein